MFNNNITTCASDFSELIPEKFKERKPTCVFVTTYSLELDALNNVMSEMFNGTLAALVRDKKIHVFFNSRELKAEVNETNHIFGDCLHQITPPKNGSFHPKVILMKYENDGEEKEYLIIVSSKNMTASSAQEAYAVASGKVSDSDQPNGAAVYSFFESFCSDYQLRYPALKRDMDTLKDLQNTQFSSDEFDQICFLNSEEVKNTLEEAVSVLANGTELLIVSPFFNLPPVIKNNISKCKLLNDRNVHAKIYCWKANGRTHWIIGSSNATYRGFNTNTEFNIYFETNEQDYKDFKSQPLQFEDVINDMGKYPDGMDGSEKTIRKIQQNIEFKERIENNRFYCDLFLNNVKELLTKKELSIKITLRNKHTKVISPDTDDDGIYLTISSEKEFIFVDVKIELYLKNELIGRKSFNYMPQWSKIDEQMHEEVCKRCNQFLIKKTESYISGTKQYIRKTSDSENETERKTETSGYSTTNSYCFEKIMDSVFRIRTGLTKDERSGDISEKVAQELTSRLHAAYRMLEGIDDQKAQDYRRLIEGLLGISKEGTNNGTEVPIRKSAVPKQLKSVVDTNHNLYDVKFQDESAKIICDGLWPEKTENKKTRFLLADEVGLGKTHTAAKVIALRAKEKKQKMKIGYICNSLTLAGKNVKKLETELIKKNLKINSKEDNRLSLSFESYYNLDNNSTGSDDDNDITLCALSPSTTLKLNGNGLIRERVYSYYLAKLAMNGTDIKDIGKKDIIEIKNQLNKDRLFFKYNYSIMQGRERKNHETILDESDYVSKKLIDGFKNENFRKYFFKSYCEFFNKMLDGKEFEEILENFFTKSLWDICCRPVSKRMADKNNKWNEEWIEQLLTHEEILETLYFVRKMDVYKCKQLEKYIQSEENLLKKDSTNTEEKTYDDKLIHNAVETIKDQWIKNGVRTVRISKNLYHLVPWVGLRYIAFDRSKITFLIHCMHLRCLLYIKSDKTYSDETLSEMILDRVIVYLLKSFVVQTDNFKHEKNTMFENAVDLFCGYIKSYTKNPPLTENASFEQAIDYSCGLLRIDQEKIIEDVSCLYVANCFEENLLKSLINTARKYLIMSSFEIMDFDLVIADEMHNYSNLIRAVNQSEPNDQNEMELLVTKIMGKDQPVLLMSATPFRYKALKNDKEAQSAAKTKKEITVSSKKEESLKKNSDVYDEFLMIATYLLKDTSRKDEWKQNWEKLEKEKHDAVKQFTALCPEDQHSREKYHNQYKDAIKKQEEMLKDINIIRTERYMAGKDTSIQTKQRNLYECEMDADRTRPDILKVLVKELVSLPLMKKKIYDSYQSLISGRKNVPEQFYLFPYCDPKNNSLNWYCSFDNKEYYSVSDDFIEQFIPGYKNNNVYYPYGYYIAMPYDDEDGYTMEGECIELDEDDENYNRFLQEMDSRNDDQESNEKQIRTGYLKSTPAPFSFSQGYILHDYEAPNGGLQINPKTIHNFEQIFYDGTNNKGYLYNARMTLLMYQLFDVEKQHRLLFIPPVHPSREPKGVFKDSWGVSKRLFFSDFYITTESLSSLLSYEAERRCRVDRDKKSHVLKNRLSNGDLLFLPDKQQNLYPFFFQDYYINEDRHCTRNYFSINPRIFYDYDKKMYNSSSEKTEHYRYGSPYVYALRKFSEISEKEKRDDIVEKFCVEYYRYLLRPECIRVLVTYVYDGTQHSLFDLIMEYGSWGCIHDVFDEFFDNGQKIDDFIKGFEATKTIPDIPDEDDNRFVLTPRFAIGYDKRGNRAATSKDLDTKIAAFNTPFLPFQFITTSIGQEGLDFHYYCRKVVHWSMEKNPLSFEQREGRINRFHSYSNRLQLELKLRKMKEAGISKEFNGWKEAFKIFSNDESAIDSYGLGPDFVFPVTDPEYGLVREFYYYPGSCEDVQIDETLRQLGYYRSLLGSYADDAYEEKFGKFISGHENEFERYFINLSSVRDDSQKDQSLLQAEAATIENAPQDITLTAEDIPTIDEPQQSVPSPSGYLTEIVSEQSVQNPDGITFDQWYGNDYRNNILNGKILIVGNSSNGRNFLFREATEKRIIAGVDSKTIYEIALPIVAESLVKKKKNRELTASGLEPISPGTASGILMGLILKDENIPREIITKNTADELLRVINMLRLNQCSVCEKNSYFDLIDIKEKYEEFLVNHKIYDNIRLLEDAVEYVEELKSCNRKCIAQIPEYAFLDDHSPSKLEYRLIELLIGHHEPIIVTARTETQKKLYLFKAYGIMDEILAVSREIQSKEYAGDVAIFYPDAAYKNAIRTIFAEYELPVYFTEGSPAAETDLFRLWISVLEWWKKDCRMEYLERIIRNVLLVNKKPDGTKAEIVISDKLLKYFGDNAGYLFGRHNFINLASSIRKGSFALSNDKYENDLAFIQDLVMLFRTNESEQNDSQFNDSYIPKNFFERLLKFCNKYCGETKSLDSCKNAIGSTLEYIDSLCSYDELYDILNKLIQSVSLHRTIDTSSSVMAVKLSGRSTVAPRKYIYIVGMASGILLKKTDESPLIRDDEILRLVGEKTASQYQGKMKNDLISSAVDYLRDTMPAEGRMTLSYPYYDQAELKLRSSSGIFENARAAQNIKDINSLSFLVSEESMKTDNDQRIFDLEEISTNEKDSDQDEKRGVLFTGIAKIPEKKEALELSASSFHTLLTCPMEFVIKYLYHIKEEVEEKQQFGRWLEANQKGLFFHSLMEKYISPFCGSEKALIERKNSPVTFIEDDYNKIFEQVKTEYDMIPYELETDKNSELEEIKKVAKSYLEYLSNDKSGYYPCAIEFKFNKNCSDKVGGLDLAYNIGFIDRVDKKPEKDPDGKYHFKIIDYKSGSIENLMKDYAQMLVQHYVYYKALKDVLGEEAVIDQFEYVFPFETKKNMYQYDGSDFILSSQDTDMTRIIVDMPALCTLNETITNKLKKFKQAYEKDDYQAFFEAENKQDGDPYCRFKDICGACRKEEKSDDR